MTKDETKQIALAGRGITLWYEKCEQSYFDMSMTLPDCTEVFTLYCSSNHEVITDSLVKKAIQKDIDNHNDVDIFGPPDLTKIFIVLYYEDMGEFFVYQERDYTLWP